MSMTELRSYWFTDCYALGGDKFSAKMISINNFSLERVDSKGLYGRWRLQVMSSWLRLLLSNCGDWHHGLRQINEDGITLILANSLRKARHGSCTHPKTNVQSQMISTAVYLVLMSRNVTLSHLSDISFGGFLAKQLTAKRWVSIHSRNHCRVGAV